MMDQTINTNMLLQIMQRLTYQEVLEMVEMQQLQQATLLRDKDSLPNQPQQALPIQMV